MPNLEHLFFTTTKVSFAYIVTIFACLILCCKNLSEMLKIIFTNVISFSMFQFPILFLGEDEIHDEKKTPLEEALGFLDIFLEGNSFVCGENLTIADCCLVASVSTIVVR